MTATENRYRKLEIQTREFERTCKVAGIFAWLRLIGLAAYGPATPTPEADESSLEALGCFKRYPVLSWDQIKLRKAREVQLQDRENDRPLSHQGPMTQYVYHRFMQTAFD